MGLIYQTLVKEVIDDYKKNHSKQDLEEYLLSQFDIIKIKYNISDILMWTNFDEICNRMGYKSKNISNKLQEEMNEEWDMLPDEFKKK